MNEKIVGRDTYRAGTLGGRYNVGKGQVYGHVGEWRLWFKFVEKQPDSVFMLKRLASIFEYYIFILFFIT